MEILNSQSTKTQVSSDPSDGEPDAGVVVVTFVAQSASESDVHSGDHGEQRGDHGEQQLKVARPEDHRASDNDAGSTLVTTLKSQGFKAKLGETIVINEPSGTTVAVGVGKCSEVDEEKIRRAVAAVVRANWNRNTLSMNLASAGFASDAYTQAATEAALLAAYSFTNYKSDPDVCKLSALHLVGASQNAIDRGVVIANAVCMARDLVNTPASDMTPRNLATVAQNVAQENGLAIDVLDEDAIEREKLGGLRGVSLGSSQPPRLIKLTYAPTQPATKRVAIVGKGITFDSGGLSLKTGNGMMTMKTDMSGAAAVIATMSAIARLKPAIEVIGFVAATENLPGPAAIKPGDVLRARNGKTMEVLNTDAEGRLVLADALSLAVEENVDAIIDIATLTGACIVALGDQVGGLMSNNDDLSEALLRAAANAGESLWRLPLPNDYRKDIDSEVADIKNIGSDGSPGALTAGLFLKEFVADVPWAHLDIAGPARASSDRYYTRKGGTGFAVRTLVSFLAESNSR